MHRHSAGDVSSGLCPCPCSCPCPGPCRCPCRCPCSCPCCCSAKEGGPLAGRLGLRAARLLHVALVAILLVLMVGGDLLGLGLGMGLGLGLSLP